MMALKCEAVGDVALFVQSSHLCICDGNHLPVCEIAIYEIAISRHQTA